MKPPEQIVEHVLHLHMDRAKDRAILVSCDGDQEATFWLPRDQIEYEDAGASRIRVLMPHWLAESRRIEE